MTCCYTGPRGQYRDAHGPVSYSLRLPMRHQRRSRRALRTDYLVSLMRATA